MNKKNTSGDFSIRKMPINHLLLIMKTTIILLFTCVFISVAGTSSTLVANDLASIMQQNKTIKGKILDEQGNPIIGANVIEMDVASNGTITDNDGNFNLEVQSNASIKITYIGYLEQIIPTTNRTEFNVTLLEDMRTLDELVVIGYGTVRKADLAGAVSVLDNKSFRDQPITQVSEAFQGRIAGVQVVNSNVPGGNVRIRVRGSGSINRSNDPLYVVDGIVRESGLTGINSDDIQSVQVLKDASSTAIYGSRGSNGVVLITTKTGSTSQRLISFDANFSSSSIYKKSLVSTKD